jgi:hypothetical protein
VNLLPLKNAPSKSIDHHEGHEVHEEQNKILPSCSFVLFVVG